MYSVSSGSLESVYPYFFFASKNEREPVYTVKKEPSLIYDRSVNSSKLKVVVEDSLPVQSNVYVTNLVIWNAGNLEIKEIDIRRDISIYVYGEGEILDYKIVEEVDPEIAQFKLQPIEDSLNLDWEYFDPGFGAEIQIIYSGNESSKIEVTGYVLGNGVKKVGLRGKNPTSILMYLFMFLISLLICIAACLTLPRDLARINTKSKEYKVILRVSILALIPIFFLLFISGYELYNEFFLSYSVPI